MISERFTVGSLTGRRAASLSANASALAPSAVRVPAIAGRTHVAALVGDSLLARVSIAMALVFVAALLYLAQASQVSVKEFAIQDLQAQNIQLNTQNANLYAKASGLTAPTRVEYIATSKFHMVRPANTLWVTAWVPAVPVIPTTRNADSIARSAPLTEMHNFITFVLDQL